ncbi:MAG: hypothetical protein LBH10_03120, partial [Burkholderiaceae bacterium]|nr:hypothetical protein [Burkholderiaceae bacterium]
MHDKIAQIRQGLISTNRGFPSWKKSALATVAALSLLGAHLDAQALALGAIEVKSALGEPLSAEVEVPEITAEEATTFQVTLGTPQEFQAAGIDYDSQALHGMRITLNHRPNGQAYLHVEGQQPVNEPFLSIVIDANWAKGRIVRDYTMLIDPPHQQAAASATAPAQQESAPAIPSAQPGRSVFDYGASSGLVTPKEHSSAAGAGEQVQVQRGDTATALVQAHPVEGVSLDQMLVAMLRANPHAFIHGNVNLIRAGAVINMPSADQASAVSPVSARRLVIAQSRNFHAYRQGLAMAATRGGRQLAAHRRSAAGNVQPQVQEIGAAPPPQDRLTLSRGQSAAGGARSRAETRIAPSRHAEEQT